MADYSGGKGLRTYTVQESLNQHLGKIIRVDATDITVGETKRMNCPTCGGYNTFTILIIWVHSFGIVTRHPVILRELQERGCL